MWNTLNSEVYFRLHFHLVCSTLPCTSSTLIMIFVLNLPSTLQKNCWWKTRRWMSLLKQIFVSFGIYNSFKTLGWHRVLNDVSIGSSLPKCGFFFLSTFQIDPVLCVLVHFPSVSARDLSWLCCVIRFFLLRFLHKIHGREEYRLPSLFRIFSSSTQTWLDNRMAILRRTCVIDVRNPIVWNFDVFLRWRMYSVPSRVALDSKNM